MMRILSWNVAHAARERPLHPDLLSAIATLRPDVLALNEYADGPSRAAFLAGLAELGLAHALVSERIARHNQVLVASRLPVRQGDLVCPPVPDTHAATNFLHVVLDDLELVALRAPSYKPRPELRTYWEALNAIIVGTRDRGILFVGDLNAEPGREGDVGARYMRDLEAAGWRVPRPTGEWSCWTKAGGRSCIDHVIASPSAPELTASYVIEGCGSYVPRAVSDHAPLLVAVGRAATFPTPPASTPSPAFGSSS
jgi:endonuclease/exonuclease/phosphatase family metal-dependent hydrolase